MGEVCFFFFGEDFGEEFPVDGDGVAYFGFGESRKVIDSFSLIEKFV